MKETAHPIPHLRLIAILGMFALLGAAAGYAQAGPKGDNEGHGKAISDRVIAWQQGLANGETLTLMAIEGEMAKVQDETAGYYFGFIPTVVDTGKKQVQIKIFTITEVAGAGEVLKEVENVTLTPGMVETSKKNPDLHFRLEGIRGPGSPES